jgi:cyclic peptide transporter
VIEVIQRSRTAMVLVAALSAVAGAANIILLILINRQASSGIVGLSEVGMFGAVLVFMIGVSFLSQRLLSRLSAKTFYRLREKLVRSIGGLSIRQADTMGSDQLYTALSRDIPAVHELIIVLPNYVFNVAVAIACLVYLGALSWPLFLILLFFLSIAILVAKFSINNRAEAKIAQRRNVEDELFQCYRAVIEGNKELKLNRVREDVFLECEFTRAASKYREVTIQAELLWNMSTTWSLAMVFVGVGILLFSASHVVIVDRSIVTTFILVIFYLIGPLTVLMNASRTIHGAKIGFSRLIDLELASASPPSIVGPPVEVLEAFAVLSVDGVSFSYGSKNDTEAFTVGPFDLEISKGDIVYFVGGNGSGKTTAAKLLMGLFPPDRGVVKLNGEIVVNWSDHLQRFSAVFQDYYLFDTIMPKRGDSDVDERAREMISKLRLTEKVTIKGGRLSTTNLSYGQRKRLALLVAYFDDSDIYVFDEWAADQDPSFRDFFYAEFLPDMKRIGKSVIVVSHDDRYFHLADKVVKFEGGSIVSTIERDTGPASLDQLARELDA